MQTENTSSTATVDITITIMIMIILLKTHQTCINKSSTTQKMEGYKIPKNTMTNMEINIGLKVTKQTPVDKGYFKQLIFALRERVGLTIMQ